MQKPIEKYSRTYFDLLEAFRQPDCAVCRLVNDAVHSYIDLFIYENINNEARRDEIRTSRGFCSMHTSLFMGGFGRLLSLAVLEQDVLNDVLRQINRALDKPAGSLLRHPGALKSLFESSTRAIREAIRPRIACPFCDYERSQERVVLGTLIQFIDDPDMWSAFTGSDALCLPHYVMALAMEGKVDRIVPVEHAMLKEVKRQVDEYVHKRNPAYGDEQMGVEAGAPSRAARLLSGRILHTDGRW